MHFRLAARRLTDFFKHQTTPFSQISDGVEQRAVEVEGDGLEMLWLAVVVVSGEVLGLLATGD
ncbi:MAG: hypothetical protein IPP59_04440 [Betaproteobacteria bacterium]|nr:hypothetical protein [Candidatus Dechloromonas phosphorivorans]